MRKTDKRWKKMSGAATREAAPIDGPISQGTEVYPPNPTKEPVDRDALRRELMQRFSRTLAELAK
jgi:hypothetical protein